jgi:hypothetical protein
MYEMAEVLEGTVVETMATLAENASKELTHDNSGIFETETVKCSKCITTKCMFQSLSLILALGLGVFMIIYLKR